MRQVRLSTTRNRFELPRIPLAFLFLAFSALALAFPAATQPVAAQDQDDDVIRVSSDLVLLNVTVVDGQGQFVSRLKRTDFTVSENGEAQTLFSFGAEETAFAAAVLLDTSSSMEKRLSLGRSAAIRFLDGLRNEDVAAVYRFDAKIERLQDFTSSRDLAPRAFSVSPGRRTVLNDAIARAADDLAQRPEKRRAVLVLSDGVEEGSSASANKALEKALAAGATIYTVNLSSTEGQRDFHGAGILQSYAEKSGGLYIPSPGGQALRDSFATVLAELGHQYTIAYRPSNKTRDGKWRTVDVKVSRPGLTVRTRKGYRAPK
jgi:Ca-activated chloride channel family protein